MINKKNNTWQNVKFVLSCCLKYDNKLCAFCIISSITSALIPLTGVFLPKFIIDELMNGKRIQIILFYLIGFLIFSCIINYLSSFFNSAKLPHSINVRMQSTLNVSAKSMNIDYAKTEDPNTLTQIETAMRATQNNHIGIEGMIHTIFKISNDLLSLISFMTIIFTLNPLILFILSINVLITYCFSLNAKKFEYSKKDEVSNVNRRHSYICKIMSDFSYGKEIRIFNMTKNLNNKFVEIIRKNILIKKQIIKKYFKTSIFSLIINAVSQIIIYSYLVYIYIMGNLTIGNFTMYLASLISFSSLLNVVMGDFANLSVQSLIVNDFRLFSSNESNASENTTISIPYSNTYQIEFKNVFFKYPNSDDFVFKDFSLKIEAGKKIAIVGLNGSGKTTLIKLLTRLYEPTNGGIFLNGINIKSFNKKEYYKIFSILFQEVVIFPFSALENVAASVNIDKDKAIRSMRLSGIYDKISSLEFGVNTCLKKIVDVGGVELSGGENQKIALSRALYKNANIIILDEPTSSLDPRAEYNIYKNFNDLTESKTSIFISHRLASTKFCDKIVFLENGAILETGTHEELINLNGEYSKMFQIQSQYYKKDIIKKEDIYESV